MTLVNGRIARGKCFGLTLWMLPCFYGTIVNRCLLVSSLLKSSVIANERAVLSFTILHWLTRKVTIYIYIYIRSIYNNVNLELFNLSHFIFVCPSPSFSLDLSSLLFCMSVSVCKIDPTYPLPSLSPSLFYNARVIKYVYALLAPASPPTTTPKPQPPLNTDNLSFLESGSLRQSSSFISLLFQ